MVQLTSIYAAALGLLFVALSARTLSLRRRLRIAIGDEGNPQMLRAMRVHANFAEYVPLGVVLLALVEHTGAAAGLVHTGGGTLLIGRLLHAVGVSRRDEQFSFRVAGMALTLGSLCLTSLYLFWRAFRNL